MILIELDRPRHLKYDWNALSDADQKLDHHLFELIKDGKILFDTARVLLWAGLKHEDPTLTIEKAGTLTDIFILKGNTPVDLSGKIMEGLKETRYFDIMTKDDGDGQKNSGKSLKSGKR